MKNTTRQALLLLAIAGLGPACGSGGGGTGPVEPTWSAHNPDNVVITTVGTDLNWFFSVSDGAGGAIVGWQDFRTGGSNADIYAQRVDATGTVRWTINGIGISTNAWSELDFRMVADGSGGAIFVWHDFRNGLDVNVFAQRVNGAGVLLWTPGGKAVTTAAGDETSPNLLADGAGGAIVVWSDDRGADIDLYAQHLNGLGDPLWTPNGLPVTTAIGGQFAPKIVPDGAGGAVVVWTDGRNGADNDLYAQRIDTNGAPQWTAGGVAISATTGHQHAPQAVSDGSGGVIVVWEDTRNGMYTDIFAGRVTGVGTPPWTPNGIAISTAGGYQSVPQIATDGAGGAILTWMDEDGGIGKVYGQRLDTGGTKLWTTGGVAVSSTTARQGRPDLVSDGAGGAVIAWNDQRNGTYDIYAQRFNAAGAVLWTLNGVGVCIQPTTTQTNPRLVPNRFGGVVASWPDTRPNGAGACIYAQGVSSTGQP
jgi:hypothetical protein